MIQVVSDMLLSLSWMLHRCWGRYTGDATLWRIFSHPSNYAFAILMVLRDYSERHFGPSHYHT